jgi:hypothetical protein
MKSTKIDNLIKDTLNPPVIVKLVLHYETQEEIEEFSKTHTETLSETEIQNFCDNCVDIEIDERTSFIITNRNYLPRLKEIFSDYNFKHTFSDASLELFQKNDVNDIISLLESKYTFDVIDELSFDNSIIQENEMLDRIKLIFKKQFTVDDVLDRINEHGVNSLNQLHKEILSNI